MQIIQNCLLWSCQPEPRNERFKESFSVQRCISLYFPNVFSAWILYTERKRIILWCYIVKFTGECSLIITQIKKIMLRIDNHRVWDDLLISLDVHTVFTQTHTHTHNLHMNGLSVSKSKSMAQIPVRFSCSAWRKFIIPMLFIHLLWDHRGEEIRERVAK